MVSAAAQSYPGGLNHHSMHKPRAHSFALAGPGRRIPGFGIGVDRSGIGIQRFPGSGQEVRLAFRLCLGLGCPRGALRGSGGGVFGVIVDIVSCTRHRNQHDRREDCRRGSAENAATDRLVCFHLYDTIPFGRVHALQSPQGRCGGLCRVGSSSQECFHPRKRDLFHTTHRSRERWRREGACAGIPITRAMCGVCIEFAHPLTYDDTCPSFASVSCKRCTQPLSLRIVCAHTPRLHMENFGFCAARSLL